MYVVTPNKCKYIQLSDMKSTMFGCGTVSEYGTQLLSSINCFKFISFFSFSSLNLIMIFRCGWLLPQWQQPNLCGLEWFQSKVVITPSVDTSLRLCYRPWEADSLLAGGSQYVSDHSTAVNHPHHRPIVLPLPGQTPCSASLHRDSGGDSFHNSFKTSGDAQTFN